MNRGYRHATRDGQKLKICYRSCFETISEDSHRLETCYTRLLLQSLTKRSFHICAPYSLFKKMSCAALNISLSKLRDSILGRLIVPKSIYRMRLFIFCGDTVQVKQAIDHAIFFPVTTGDAESCFLCFIYLGPELSP